MSEERRSCDCTTCGKKGSFDRVDQQLGFVGLADGWLPVRRRVWSGDKHVVHYAATCSLPCALAWSAKHAPLAKAYQA